jgi:methyl-accepting chemotaxis protein
MKTKNLPLSTQLALGFGAVVLVLLIVGAISLRSQFQLNDAVAINEHTFKVLATGELMQANALNVQTSTRGYLLSSNKDYLQPFALGQAGFEKNFAEAKRLTADNPRQQARLAQLQTVYQEFLQIEQRIIALRERPDSQ